MNEHHSRLYCKKREAPIVDHCLEYNHKFKELHCFRIDQIAAGYNGKSKEQTLLIREQRWIYTLQSVIPEGLNARIDWSVCI